MLLKDIHNDYKIFVDIDGVLANFDKKMKTLFPDFSFAFIRKDKDAMSRMWKEILDYNKAGGRFWAELELLPDAKKLMRNVRHLDTEILTSTGGAPDAGPMKKEWISRNIDPNIKVNLVTASKKKAEYVKGKNYVLIDDQFESVKPWKAAGGIGILHSSTEKTLSELRERSII
jgi:hypothetical protein